MLYNLVVTDGCTYETVYLKTKRKIALDQKIAAGQSVILQNLHNITYAWEM